MTHGNIFQEIDEDLERQRLETLWKKYGPVILAAAAAIVLATGGFSAWHSLRAAQEQKATASLIAILGDASAADSKQIEALESFAAKNTGETQATFAELHAAASALKAGDQAKATALYDKVAADTGADPAFRQLADLLAVQAKMDDGDPVALQKRLQPLLADGAPWRQTAMEYEAFLALKAGDKAKARQLFTELSQDASAPQSLSARAADMLHVVGE